MGLLDSGIRVKTWVGDEWVPSDGRLLGHCDGGTDGGTSSVRPSGTSPCLRPFATASQSMIKMADVQGDARDDIF